MTDESAAAVPAVSDPVREEADQIARAAGYTERHFGDVLQNWPNGVQLDIRTKLAVDFLKAGMLARPGELAGVLCGGPVPTDMNGEKLSKLVVTFALDLATELLNVSQERGLTKPLPDNDEISGAHRLHIRRLTRAQIIPQTLQQRLGLEETDGSIQRAPAGLQLG